MPTVNDLRTDTQGQLNTISQNGSNRVAKFKAKSYFFLEDGVFTQAQSQAFGVVSADEFQTTAQVSVTSAKKVIAVCTGQIFVQPQSGLGADANKVNVILKPYKQPVNGLAIKYFIYRGLPKSDFFDSSGKVLATGSELITQMRNEFTSFYASTTPLPDFPASFIGFPDASSTQQETDKIEYFFDKVSQSFVNETGPGIDPKFAFEMPMITAGMHIATIPAGGSIGLDILLNSGDHYTEDSPGVFKLNLKVARAAKNVIGVSTISDLYQKRAYREACTLFLDPAAYYGSHANGGTINRFAQNTAIETPDDVAALISNFFTRRNIYLYIQSNRQRSYNFYNNQRISSSNANDIKSGVDENSLGESSFETNNWPVHVFSTTPLSNGDVQTLTLQLTTDRAYNSSLFVTFGNVISEHQNGFVDSTALLMTQLTSSDVLYFTKPVKLAFPVSNGQNIASFSQLNYKGKDIRLARPVADDGDPNTPLPAPELYPIKPIDDVFYLIRETPLLSESRRNRAHSYLPTLFGRYKDGNTSNLVTYLHRTRSTVVLGNNQQLNMVTYLSLAESAQNGQSGIAAKQSSNTEATGYETGIALHTTVPNLPANEFVQRSVFLDSGRTITNIRLQTTDGTKPVTLALGISESENDIIKNISLGTRNPRFYFDPAEPTVLDNIGDRPAKYRLGVLVDKQDFTQDTIFPNATETVTVYSSDGQLFYSELYSRHIDSSSESPDFNLINTELINF